MNVYEQVTARIMEILATGTVPWKKPWRSSDGAKNLISKKPYRGINQFLLNCSPYSSPYWMTFNQARQKGGSVNKGEKSTAVVFWKWINTVSEDDEPGSENTIIKKPYKLHDYTEVKSLNKLDALLVFNGPINFFGGSEDPGLPKQYELINSFDGPAYYVMTDCRYPMIQLWKYPNNWQNLFMFRVDTDFCSTKEAR